VEAWAWRVGPSQYEGPAGSEVFQLFLDTVDTSRVRALVLGAWDSDAPGNGFDEFQRALLGAADRFPSLEALFLSDVPQEMSEISWIAQHDPGDLLAAFPKLRVLGMRGAEGLSIEPFVHARIEELTLQSGGLPREVVQALGRSNLPELNSLELYPGTTPIAHRARRGGAPAVGCLSPPKAASAIALRISRSPWQPEPRPGRRESENTDVGRPKGELRWGTSSLGRRSPDRCCC
jgi:hypothetical protein